MKIEISFAGNKKVNARINDMVIQTDQPIRAGGDGNAPTPFDLFLASLGTCAGIFVKSFCDQRGIPTDNIRLIQDMEYDHARHLISSIEIRIEVPADFPEKYKEAVKNAANLCSVKRHLHEPPQMNVMVVTS
jgi:putative redox protein